MVTPSDNFLKKVDNAIHRVKPFSKLLASVAELIIPQSVALAEWIPPCASGYQCAYRGECGSTGCTFCRDGKYHTGRYTKYYFGYLQGSYCVPSGSCNQCWTDIDYCTVPTTTSC
mgnify:CR=1 FL=1